MNNLPPILYPKIPILLYHHIAETPRNYLTVDPTSFASQMNHLCQSGFTTISLHHLYQAYHTNFALPEKPVVITFDDGLLNQYTNALPVLRTSGFTATFFIPTGAIQKCEEGRMTWKQIVHMKRLGMSIEAHSITHPDLRTLSTEEQTREICLSKAIIERNLGMPVSFFAYPGGLFNNVSLIIARRCGYLGAVTGEPGLVEIGDDPYTLKRTAVAGGYTLEDFKRLVSE